MFRLKNEITPEVREDFRRFRLLTKAVLRDRFGNMHKATALLAFLSEEGGSRSETEGVLPSKKVRLGDKWCVIFWG